MGKHRSCSMARAARTTSRQADGEVDSVPSMLVALGVLEDFKGAIVFFSTNNAEVGLHTGDRLRSLFRRL